MAVDSERLTSPISKLEGIAQRVLELARTAGATAADTDISQGVGQNVSVRKGEIETIEYNRDNGVSLTVYLGQQRGHASTSDTSEEALAATVEKALAIARYTASDPAAGLAEPRLLAREWKDLDLHHAWGIAVEDAAELARRCEAAAFAVDSRIRNSEGAGVSTYDSQFVYANSNGFCGGYRGSRHSVSCAVIAEQDGGMQRDYWYTTAREAGELEDAEAVGRRAGQRAIRRLGARKIDTRQTPVIFEAPVAAGLIGHFVGAVSGGSLYRRASFLIDSLGQPVFAPLVTIRELPHLPRGLASAPFDDEGVATRDRYVVEEGIVQGYFLGSYSGRKLGMESTGNAGGNHNLIVSAGTDDLPSLLKRMGDGLLVTELMGQGINAVTGDYSRGAVGFWVQGGELAHPVEEITIAGNLRQMYRDIVAIGSDVERRGSKQVGSILISNITLAGN
jgi:PmbA protein